MMDFDEIDKAWADIVNPRMATISWERAHAIQSDGYTRRICFAPYNESGNYLKRSQPSSGFAGSLNFPFSHGISRIFPWDLFAVRHKDKNPLAVWRSIRTQEEFAEIEDWIQRRGQLVVLRDCLAISIALATNLKSEFVRSDVGELESKAKNYRDMVAVEALANMCIQTISNLPCYNKTAIIAAVPSKAGKEFHLPNEIVARISSRMDAEVITSYFSDFESKPKLKDIGIDKKWSIWNATGLRMTRDLSEQDVILIDDLYQSGTTLQFVAMKLQEAGARNVFGLCLVKSWSNTDNQ